KQRREHVAVRLQDGVLGVEDVHVHGAVIGIDGDLDAVADVVHLLAVNGDRLGVGVLIAGGVGVDHPEQVAMAVDDQVGIGIVAEEWRQRLDPVHDLAVHEQAGGGGEVVGEEDVGVVLFDGGGHAQRRMAEDDAGGAGVVGVAVVVAFGVIELVLLGVDEDAAGGVLAEVEAGAGDLKVGEGAGGRGVLEDEVGLALG